MKDEFKYIDEILFEALGLKVSNISYEKEAGDYCGFNFQLGKLNMKFRRAKITPKKTGQFVALWKRSSIGKTEPFGFEDHFDFYIIGIGNGNNSGCFVFPGTILAEQNILSVNGREGKRGFRTYSKWDMPENKQARQTQSWQILYFIDLIKDRTLSIQKLQEIIRL